MIKTVYTQGGQPASVAFGLEVEALKRLKGKRHFPQLVGYNKGAMTIETEPYSRRGVVAGIHGQIKTIIDTLRECGIEYLSRPRLGVKDDELLLTDFGHVVLDGKPATIFMDMRYQAYMAHGERGLKKMIYVEYTQSLV